MRSLPVGLVLLIVTLAAIVALSQRALPPDYRLTLVDLEGHRTVVGAVPGTTFAPRISPDGREVLFDTSNDGQIWIARLSDVASRRRLSTGGSNRGPLWSGDGKRILYITDDAGEEALFWRAADGSGTPELLTKPVRAPESWQPGDAGVSFITLNSPGDYDVWIYSLVSRRRIPFVVVPRSAQHSSHFSPDGHWIAYASAESGRLEVYVRPFPAGTPAVQISRGGGEHPQWSPDQKQLYFDTGRRVFSVSVKLDGSFAAGTPAPLPITGFIQGPLRRQYDLMPDGNSFLMLFPGE